MISTCLMDVSFGISYMNGFGKENKKAAGEGRKRMAGLKVHFRMQIYGTAAVFFHRPGFINRV